jgi:hypothetical protein
MINIPAIFFARSMGIDYPATNPTASNLIESLSKVDSITALGRSRLIFKGIDFSKSTTAKDALFKLLSETYELVGRIENNFGSLISAYVFAKLVDVGNGSLFQSTDLNDGDSKIDLQIDILNLGRIIEFMTEDERTALMQGFRDSIEQSISRMSRSNDFRQSSDAVRKMIFLLSRNHDQFAVSVIEMLLAAKVKESNKGLPVQLSLIIKKLLIAVDRSDTDLVDKLIIELSTSYGSNNLISRPVEIFELSKSKSMWDSRDSESWREQL